MNWMTITPGSMGAVSLAIDLFGVECVDPGSWMTPVRVEVSDLKADDIEAAADLLKIYNLSFNRER